MAHIATDPDFVCAYMLISRVMKLQPLISTALFTFDFSGLRNLFDDIDPKKGRKPAFY